MIKKNILIILVLMINTVGATELTSEDVGYIGSDEFKLNSEVNGFSLPSGLPQEVKQRIINRSLMGMTEEQKTNVLKSRMLSKPERFEQQISNDDVFKFNLSERFLFEMFNESGIQINNGQYIPNQYMAGIPNEFKQQYLDNNVQSESTIPGAMGSSFTISGNVSILWEKHTTNNDTYAYAVNDLDGDSKPDILVRSTNISGITQTDSITALRGYDGYQLWTKSETGDVGYFYLSFSAYNDFTGDGLSDVIIQSRSISGTSETQTITGLRGYDGYQLWTRSESGVVGYFYLSFSAYNDFTGDGLPDVIIQSRSISGTSETQTITGLRGYDGYQLWTNSVSGDLNYVGLSVTDYQDITGDGKPDIQIQTWSRSGTSATDRIICFRGYDGYQLWNKSITGESVWIYGYLVNDLSGDGKPDFVIGMGSYNSVSPVTVTAYVLRGYDGYQLISKSITGTNIWIYANSAGDLSGDGVNDVLIGMSVYNGGSSVTATAYALRGDGYQLWSRSITGLYVGINAYSGGDLNGDGKLDVLVEMSNYGSGTSVATTAYALRGYDGYQLWSKSIAGTYNWINANQAGDLNGDGMPDVLLQTGIYEGSAYTSSVKGLRGYDGYELWTKSITGTDVSINGYSAPDLTGDGLPDIILQTSSISSPTETGTIAGLRGYDGYQIWSKSVSGDYGYTNLYASTYQDLTGDGLADVIINAQSKSGTTQTASVTGLQGNNGVQLWSKSVSGDYGYTNLYASTYQDLTGDGLADVIINAQSKSGTTQTAGVTGLQGNNGVQLWSKSVSGDYGYTNIYAYTDQDLTGDGLSDAIINAQSKSGTTQTSSVSALRGRDGSQLWSRSVSGDYAYISGSPFLDLTGDNLLDILISTQSMSGTTRTMSLAALRGYDGNQLWSRSWSGENISWQGILLDGDNNGQYDIVLLENISSKYISPKWIYESTVEVFNLSDGTTLWTAGADSIMLFSGWNPDLNGDNKTDVLISTQDSVYALTLSSPTGAPSIRGDINRNGIRDTGDATLILRYLVELPLPSDYLPILPTGDMNCNDIIDTGDATLVLRDIVGQDIPMCWQ